MNAVHRYRLIFSRPGDSGGAGAATDEVVVERTDDVGPGGNPVYRDVTGIFLAEISPAGEVRMLASGGYQSPRLPSVEPLG
ncbi:DUF6296 family protein [Streptomyces sp. TP-A0874]|uniref:DUF6296 family protein n=1 Tax=Streptomyces sp. TP-A0874 TaxID=549819 RepID=UPI0008535E03|nr:DUF6296 family protein [Streptomyces sp. TP-A0874]